MDVQPRILLKHGQLKPCALSLVLPCSDSSDPATLVLQIGKD